MHNVYHIGAGLLSGSSPEGDEGFRSLRELGVKTVISVDGARPDVGRARKYGLRYVHLPIGYDGIPRPQLLRLARAVRDLPGLVYLHCHHGKHRGPAAAAAVHLCLDERCSVEQALSEMRRSGTDPRYTGLFRAVEALERPTPQELDGVPDEFPEVAEVSAMAQVMVEIDARWVNLGRVRSAGWKVPSDHPDLDPAHEALQLAEQYREMARTREVANLPEEFRRWLAQAEKEASSLERALRSWKQKGADPRTADAMFSRMRAACARCHAKYRDVPKPGG